MSRNLPTQTIAIVATIVVLLATVADAQIRVTRQPVRNQKTAAAPRTVSLAGVISTLNREVRLEWKKTGQWPRSESNFAAEKNWALPNDQILQGLTRKLSNNPAIDSYIKWQLLSFGPDFSKADKQTLNRVLAMIPDTIQQPEPKIDMARARSGGGGLSMNFGASNVAGMRDISPVVGDGVALQDPKVSVLNQGTSLDTGGAVSLDGLVVTANVRMDRARANLRQINQAIFAYRTELRDRMPAEGGWRIGMLIHDVSDRIAAGDPSYNVAAKLLVQASDEYGSDPTITTAYRRKLLGWIDELGKYKRPVVDQLYLDNGRIHSKTYTVAMEPRDIEIIRDNLRAGFNQPAAPATPAPDPTPEASTPNE